MPSLPPGELDGSRTTGVHERPAPPELLAPPPLPPDTIEDVHPSELEYTATLLELGALTARANATSDRSSGVHERAPHLYRRALQLARERGPYASVASIEGALQAVRLAHAAAPDLEPSVDRARALLASLAPSRGERDPSR